MERFGFVGLPNAGKSSLYNALAGGGALAAPYAFATVDPNIGVAKVPDPRVELLGEMSSSRELVHAAVQFVDIAGLVKGAAQGEGLGNRFLSHIREVDAIVFVLRAFRDEDVPGPHDPLEQLETLEIELVYADLESVDKQVEKRRKAAKGDRSLVDEVAALDAAIASLEAGVPLYRSPLTDEQLGLLTGYFLLTAKPALALVNLDEEQLEDPEPVLVSVRSAFGDRGDEAVMGLCIQLEAEAAMLDDGLSDVGAAHIPDHRGEGVAGVDLPGGLEGPAGCRGDPHRLRARVHQGPGDPLGRAAGLRFVGQGPRRRQGARGGQGLRGGRRRRDRVPLQRLMPAGRQRTARGCLETGRGVRHTVRRC
jgi:GTP-binding protein YchF